MSGRENFADTVNRNVRQAIIATLTYCSADMEESISLVKHTVVKNA